VHAGVKKEHVKVDVKDGVLTLSMRKPAEVKPRGVSIKID
jgi:HSP20 family molecular chaperone IbpA